MHTIKRLAAAASVAAIAGVASLAAGPASADTGVFRDAVADVRHGVDLRTVSVINEKNVRVVIRHDDLVHSYRSNAGVTVWLDTVPAEPGPEFAFTGGVFEGADYALLRTDGWRFGRIGEPLTCSYEMNLDYARDITRIRMSRACLDKPGKVRVAVKAGGAQRDGDMVTDWLHQRRAFTPWVRH
jgi:hypothetical protein